MKAGDRMGYICPVCFTENPCSQRHCRVCGAAVSRRWLAQERRTARRLPQQYESVLRALSRPRAAMQAAGILHLASFAVNLCALAAVSVMILLPPAISNAAGLAVPHCISLWRTEDHACFVEEITRRTQRHAIQFESALAVRRDTLSGRDSAFANALLQGADAALTQAAQPLSRAQAKIRMCGSRLHSSNALPAAIRELFHTR